MSTQLNLNTSVNADGSATFQTTSSEVGSADIKINQTFGAGTSNAPITAAFAVANVEGFCLIPTANMTLKTNSSGSPAQTFNLIANEPFVWKKGWSGWYSNPFTADVTGFYISCTNTATLKGHIVTA